MDSTGRYVVRYEPSNSEHEYLQTRVEMSISDEATYDDMANFFDCFLKAAGFVYEGSLQVIEDKSKRKTYDICEPVGQTAKINWGSPQNSFTGCRGGMAEDILKL